MIIIYIYFIFKISTAKNDVSTIFKSTNSIIFKSKDFVDQF
jgi:hypothetical protein